MASKIYKLMVGGASVGAGTYFTTWILTGENPTKLQTVQAEVIKKTGRKRTLPPRNTQIESLQSENFDVLIIGGGATGAGCAIDSVTRGLKTALVELDDFASGTSSRSTKLIHGGVRYLQKAILNLDYEQYKMVKEALHERSTMLQTAPHLTHAIPIMLPVYEWWKVPYYWVGIKAYDFVAGFKNVKSSYYLSKNEALEIFPMLKKNKLVGAIVYHDGQQDDARMCLALALTATRYGATVANHVKAMSLLKDSNGKICGAHLRDELTGKEWDVKAKCVINAAGPFTDSVRKMDDKNVQQICTPSKGVHIVLPGYYSPEQMGLLDPETSDGRVIFFLPWQKHTLSGTTDSPCNVTYHPTPTEEEISFILNEIKNYLNSDVEVRRGDVLSAWSGIRPLVSDPNKEDTQSLARNHIVHVSKSNLVTIAGGKWTTYRSMAQETLDAAIKAIPELNPTKPDCQTDGLKLEGSHGWTPTMYIRLVQDFGLECEVAQHLATSYGDRAFAVAKLAHITGQRWPIIGKKIHPDFPYIDAEIRYGVREYAMTAVDMIARRLRLAFLNVQACQEALPTIVNIMAEELNWSEDEKQKQLKAASDFLATEMGMSVNRASRDKIPITLSKDEIKMYMKRFQLLDSDRKGYVSINDIRRSMRNAGEEVSGKELHEILKEIDTNMNGQVELDEYLQMMSAIKSGHITYSRFATMAALEEQAHNTQNKISVERSGGGL
ncbi:glycerol-3-phosphate dehydrogenase, mitochondrial [Daktulosphaira vitifoliae]|uniref:glycerol-3-phosphate dehydrogenase, mitochondrial n=1 Tax=Daktulosphaira vitifoliae TaxID=58002 RepID=UPI0021A9A851|nr:glycerol-3-phosphate dehydrogenase, mitochondrial [Daktulosphaira vitifoliae]